MSIYKYSNLFYFTICMNSYNTVVFIEIILIRISFRFWKETWKETWKESISIPTKVAKTISIDLSYNTIGIFYIVKTFCIRISCVSIIYVKIPSLLPLSGEGPLFTFVSDMFLPSLFPGELYLLI